MSETTAAPQLEFMPSRQFPEWLAENRLSLCFSTYQAGKLFFIGLQPSGRLSIFERTFNRSMGLWSDGQTIWMTSLYQIWRFENILKELELSFQIHEANGSFLGGVHIELTGEDVTECTGGARGLTDADLARAYRSTVDPRLNYEQALELAMLIGRHGPKR